MPATPRPAPRGFTLVELLVVIAIVGLISAVALPVVLPALNEFSAAAAAAVGANKKAFADARSQAQHFYNYDCADIGSFMSLLKVNDAKVTAAQNKLAAAYKAAIVREGHTKQFPGATGNVMYFPTPGDTINSVYLDASKIAFAKEGWKNFLKAYGAK